MKPFDQRPDDCWQCAKHMGHWIPGRSDEKAQTESSDRFPRAINKIPHQQQSQHDHKQSKRSRNHVKDAVADIDNLPPSADGPSLSARQPAGSAIQRSLVDRLALDVSATTSEQQRR